MIADIFSDYPEAFPCHTNKAKEVVIVLLKEIPRFWVPEGISSDRGPHFVVEIIWEVSKFLQIKWDLHTLCRPQSSGKIERMNQTIKQQIRKLRQEILMNCTMVLTPGVGIAMNYHTLKCIACALWRI